MKRQCRIWLPKLLSSTDDLIHSLMFGWFVSHSSSCLDVVVAFVTDESSLSSDGGSSLQDVLHETNEKMPLTLRDKAAFTLLGCYDSCLSANGNAPKNATDEDMWRYSSLSCGCHKVGGLLEKFRSSHWIHMVHDSSIERGIRMHHIHWNGDIVSQCDVHVCYSL